MQVLDLKWVASILNFWFTNCFQEQDMYFRVNLYLLFKSPLPCNREIPRILIYMLSMLESTPKLVKPKLVLKRFDSIHGHVLIFVVIFCSYQEIVCDIKLVGCCLGPHLCWNKHVEVGRWPFRTEDCISFPPLHHWKCWLGCLHCIVIGAVLQMLRKTELKNKFLFSFLERVIGTYSCAFFCVLRLWLFHSCFWFLVFVISCFIHGG